jgi:hypothetical protein
VHRGGGEHRPSVLMLSGSDTTDATAFAAIKALFGDGAQGFQIPEWHADSATQKSLKFNIDCRARKRDLNLTIVPCTTQDCLCVVNLNAAEIAPSDTTAANVPDLIDA